MNPSTRACFVLYRPYWRSRMRPESPQRGYPATLSATHRSLAEPFSGKSTETAHEIECCLIACCHAVRSSTSESLCEYVALQHTARLDGRRCSLLAGTGTSRSSTGWSTCPTRRIFRSCSRSRTAKTRIRTRAEPSQTNKLTNRLCLWLDALSRRCAALPDAPLPPSPVNSCCTHTAAHTVSGCALSVRFGSGRVAQRLSLCAVCSSAGCAVLTQFHRSHIPAGRSSVHSEHVRYCGTVCKSSARMLTD